MGTDGADTRETALLQQAAILRNGRHLGKSAALTSLFDYLIQTSQEGRSPKEVEVAVAVFDRGDSFDAVQDASVRVYAYRLRKKLAEYYAGPGAAEPWRIVMLKGEYRLLAERAGEGAEEAGDAPAAPLPVRASPSLRPLLLTSLATALVCALIAVGIWALYFRPDGPERAMAQVRQSHLWRPIMPEEKPIIIVVGDYYIFGETDPAGDVQRLVREFSINSRYELDERIMKEPSLSKRYRDVGLRYYPIGVATALRDIVPVLRTGERRNVPIRIIPMSDLTPDTLRVSNIIYVGYLSGLGALRNPVFAASRFAVGSSYDELYDRRSDKVYQAVAGDKPTSGPQQDYGYISTFDGPNQNRIVIIAGTRDAGLMQAADYAAQAHALRDIEGKAGKASAFEALLRVDTLGDQNLAGKLLLASPLNSSTIWRGGSSQHFPDDPNSTPADW